MGDNVCGPTQFSFSAKPSTMWIVGKWVKYNQFLLKSFSVNYTGHTKQRIFTLDGSNYADSR